MLFLVGCCWGVLADLPHIPAMVLLLLSGAFAMPKSLRLNRRALVYLVILSLVLMWLGNSLFPFETNRFGIFVMIFQGELANAAVLYAGAMLLYFWYPRVWGGLVTAAVLFVLGSIGDLSSFSSPSLRIPFDPAFLEPYFRGVFVALSLLLAVGALTLVMQSEGRTPPPGRRGGRGRIALKLGALLLAFLLWSLIWQLYQAYSREIAGWEQRLLLNMERSAAQNQRRRRIIQMSQEVNLRQGFPPHRDSESEILIRVEGPEAPGYLRGRALHEYADGIWKMPPVVDGESRQELEAEAMPGLSATAFRFAGEQPEIAMAWQFLWSGNFRSEYLLLPGNYAQLEVIGDRVYYLDDGQTAAPDFLRSGGYRVGVAAPDQAAPWPRPPAAEEESKYRRRPDELRSVLQRILAEIGLAAEMPFREKLLRLGGFFADNFTYQLGVDIEGEPVTHFLEKSRSGHCELFASAAVLLARELGIPGRYVTGFLCFEAHPSERYFVARVGHAHAWTELFDPETGRWVLFDPTPASELPDYSSDWSFGRSARDRLDYFWKQLLADLRRGEIALLLKRTLFSLPGLLAIAAAAGLYLYFKFFRRRRRTRRQRYTLRAEHEAWRRRYERLLRTLAAKGKLEFSPGVTATEVLALVRASELISPAEKAEAEAFIAAYRDARFRPAGGTGEQS